MGALFIFDLIGTFAFAAFGAYSAEKKGYDIFGVFSCAAISALGGGTIREILLNSLPSYFNTYSYWLAIVLGTAFAIIIFDRFEQITFWMLVIDAAGLITFAFIGADRAWQVGLGFVGVVFCSVLTAVGGGVLRDVVMREEPLVFRQDFYATPAFLFGAGYFLLERYWQVTGGVYLLILAMFALRIFAIKLKIQLWKPHKTLYV